MKFYRHCGKKINAVLDKYMIMIIFIPRGPYSSVIVVTGLRSGDQVWFPAGAVSIFVTASRPALMSVAVARMLEAVLPGRTIGAWSLPLISEFKNAWNFTSTSHTSSCVGVSLDASTVLYLPWGDEEYGVTRNLICGDYLVLLGGQEMEVTKTQRHVIREERRTVCLILTWKVVMWKFERTMGR